MITLRQRICRTFVLLGLAAVSLSASAFLDELIRTFQGSPYPVIHSKYAAVSRGVFYRLSWLDNDRIFFAGEPIEEVLARFDGKRFVRAGKKRFYIWNTSTNEVATYREDVDTFGTFCYNEFENWIRYPIPGKKNVLMEGKLGEEREVEIDPAEHTPQGRASRGVFFHDLTCREYPYAPKDAGVDERRVFPLFDDHGMLDVWGNQVDARPIKLFTKDYQRHIELLLPRRAIAPSKIYYSRFKGAYAMAGFTAPPSFSNNWGDWPKGVNQPVYLLYPTGKLSLAAEIPWHKQYREALDVYFTVRGLVYAGGREPSNKGFFLVENEEVIRLLQVVGPKSMEAGAVSPDGCKVAVAVSMYGADKTGGVKVIELCREKAQ